MMSKRTNGPVTPVICTMVIVASLAAAATPSTAINSDPDQPVYRPAYEYPILDEIREAREAHQAERDSLKRLVDARYEREAERDTEEERELRLDWSGIDKPPGPDAFASAFHFPPMPQYATGTCWAFCSTSFFESEACRRTGRQLKLSEMWTVYWEWVEKARRFVREYGHSKVSSGSLCQATREIYRQYGTVPADAYPGILTADGRHDHSLMTAELRSYLAWVEENDFWDEEKVIDYVRSVMNRHMGIPPRTIDFEGKTFMPRMFLSGILKLDMDDYVEIVSTMREPFVEWIRFDVYDNWRRREDFLNLPLDDFYRVIRTSVAEGYTVTIGGDVSEPGVDGMEDAAVVPSFDIPAQYIDQGSREFRIYNRTTTDDHGVHVVGVLPHGGRDWFLGKDSNRSSRLGQFKGYYFFDGDYIRLKMLSCMVHRDRLAGLLPDEPPPERRGDAPDER